MSYQGDGPNRPQERQRTGTGYQQPQGSQPQQTPQSGQRPQGGRGPQQPRQQTAQQSQQPGQQRQSSQQWQQQAQQPQQGQYGAPQQPQRSQQPQYQATGTTQQSYGTGQPGPSQQPQTKQSAGGMPPQARGQQQPGMQMQTQRQPGMAGPQFAPMTVEEVIQTDVVVAQPNTPISTVAASMAENDVGSVVVVEEDGETPIDILTDRKLALALETTPDIAERNAEAVITDGLVTGTTDMTVFEALEQLNQENIRRLPIVNEEGTLQGIVTLDDLLILLGTSISDAAEIIAAQADRSA